MANATSNYKEGVDPYEGCLPDGLLFKKVKMCRQSLEMGRNLLDLNKLVLTFEVINIHSV